MTNKEIELTIDYLKDIQEGYIEGEGYEKHPLPEWYALDKAIELLEHTKWIPVTERLPEPQEEGDKDFSEWVLITLYIGENDYIVLRALYCFSEKKWHAERFGCGKVIAWMPLPHPYKESEE